VVTGSERTAGYLDRQLTARASAAVRAAHALAAVLSHDHVDRRQLLDLMTRRLAIGDPLRHTEDVPAATLAGPLIDELVHRPRWQQRPALAAMARLRTLLATRGILAAPGRRARRVGARRLRRVSRRTLRHALKLRDPLLLTRQPRRQRPDLHGQTLVLRRELHQYPYHDPAPCS
jgi:hypothetical protein